MDAGLVAKKDTVQRSALKVVAKERAHTAKDSDRMSLKEALRDRIKVRVRVKGLKDRAITVGNMVTAQSSAQVKARQKEA